jgi:hypothetical protein
MQISRELAIKMRKILQMSGAPFWSGEPFLKNVVVFKTSPLCNYYFY